MDKQLIHTQIANLLETIIEQQEIIASHEDSIPQIELDILLANIRRLYELNRTLEKIASKPVPLKRNIKKAISTQPVVPDLFATTFAVDPSAPAVPTSVSETIQPVIAETANENQREAVPSPVVENFIEETVLAELQTIVEEATAVNDVLEAITLPEEIIIEERLPNSAAVEEEMPVFETVEAYGALVSSTEVKETVHDKILQSANEEHILANKLKKQPIADLRAAIGINEKFLFINEIFNADGVAYSNSIDFINQCKSLAEATVYVNTILKSRFNWALDNKRVTDFLDLVERRFL